MMKNESSWMDVSENAETVAEMKRRTKEIKRRK